MKPKARNPAIAETMSIRATWSSRSNLFHNLTNHCTGLDQTSSRYREAGNATDNLQRCIEPCILV